MLIISQVFFFFGEGGVRKAQHVGYDMNCWHEVGMGNQVKILVHDEAEKAGSKEVDSLPGSSLQLDSTDPRVR